LKKLTYVIISFFLLISLNSTQTVTARLPEFTGNFVVSDYSPYVDRTVTITVYVNIYDPDGQQIPFISLNVYLMWSRDSSTWYSVTMTTTTFQVFTGDIPAQDGSDNKIYNAGAGTLYWYALMRNEANEEDTFYSPSSPNSDITYLSTYTGGETTTETTTEPAGDAGVLQPVFDILSAFVDPTTDPFVRLVLIGVVGMIVFLLTSKGKGLESVKGVMSGLFKK